MSRKPSECEIFERIFFFSRIRSHIIMIEFSQRKIYVLFECQISILQFQLCHPPLHYPTVLIMQTFENVCTRVSIINLVKKNE